MGRLNELKEFIDSIKNRVDSMCKDVCGKYNLEYSDEFKDSDCKTTDDVVTADSDDNENFENKEDSKKSETTEKDDDSEKETKSEKSSFIKMKVIDVNNESRIYSLYDLSKCIFESMNGENEDGGDYGFNDYVSESFLQEGHHTIAESKSIDKFYGCEKIVESNDYFSIRNIENRLSTRLGRKINSLNDLNDEPTDSTEIRELKKKMKDAFSEKNGLGIENTFKQNKKQGDMYTDINGEKTGSYLYHNGLNKMGAGINRKLNQFIPTFLVNKIKAPSKLAGLGAAALGGLAFGPLGIVGGYLAKKGLEHFHNKWNEENKGLK